MSAYSIVLGGTFRTTTVGVVESTNLAVWTDELATIAPGSTINVMKLGLRTAFREFCVRSGAWIRELTDLPVEAGTDWYNLPEQADAQIVYILHMVWSDDGGIRYKVPGIQAPFDHAIHNGLSDRILGYTGSPETPETYKLVPTPKTSREDVLHVWVALGPKDPHADDIPKHFLTYHFDAILEGAASKLLAQSNKPYTNLVMAQYYARRFNTAIARARDVARRQYSMTESHWSFPRWA